MGVGICSLVWMDRIDLLDATLTVISLYHFCHQSKTHRIINYWKLSYFRVTGTELSISNQSSPPPQIVLSFLDLVLLMDYKQPFSSIVVLLNTAQHNGKNRERNPALEPTQVKSVRKVQ